MPESLPPTSLLTHLRPPHTSHTSRYEEDPQRRDRFYYHMLRGGGSPPERCTTEIMRIVVQQHLSCPSVWAIFPVQV